MVVRSEELHAIINGREHEGMDFDWLPSRRTCGCEPGNLNCLTRKETFELGSTLINVRARHHWEEKHPARFIPELPERYIKLFSHRGETVLDPFCGSGTTNVVAKQLGRNSIGVDVNPRSAAMAIARLESVQEDALTRHKIINGDSRKALGDLPAGSIDLAVTSPPYFDVVDYEHEDLAQIGNWHDYPTFLEAMEAVFRGCLEAIKPNGHLVVNTQDLYKKNLKAPIHADYINICREIGFELININIYVLNYSNGGRLVFGYPKAYYPKNDHEFNLIFRKPLP
jgi:DNA modification methylase